MPFGKIINRGRSALGGFPLLRTGLSRRGAVIKRLVAQKTILIADKGGVNGRFLVTRVIPSDVYVIPFPVHLHQIPRVHQLVADNGQTFDPCLVAKIIYLVGISILDRRNKRYITGIASRALCSRGDLPFYLPDVSVEVRIIHFIRPF